MILLLYCNRLPAANARVAGAARNDAPMAGAVPLRRPTLAGRGDGPVPEHRGNSGVWRRRIGECTTAAERREVVGCGYHQTSSVNPLPAACVLTPREHGAFEIEIMVSANGNTPIIFLSDAAEPHCIGKELQ